MPEISSKVRIEFDPAKWPPDKLAHIRDEQELPPWVWPEVLIALAELQKRKFKAKHGYEAWFIPLEKFNPKLQKFKLVGHGAQPDSLIKPGESKIEGRNLTASFELPEPASTADGDFSDVDSNPNSLDLG